MLLPLFLFLYIFYSSIFIFIFYFLRACQWMRHFWCNSVKSAFHNCTKWKQLSTKKLKQTNKRKPSGKRMFALMETLLILNIIFSGHQRLWGKNSHSESPQNFRKRKQKYKHILREFAGLCRIYIYIYIYTYVYMRGKKGFQITCPETSSHKLGSIPRSRI